MNKHFIGGIPYTILDMNEIHRTIEKALESKLTTEIVIRACEKAAPMIKSMGYHQVAKAFDRTFIEEKLMRELGGVDPFVPRRVRMEQNVFECYKPLGVLTHVAAGNGQGVGALSVLEGLIAGNVNILKPSSKDGSVIDILKTLIQCDLTGCLKNYISIVNISSAEQETLKQIFQISDAAVVWGSNDTIESVKRMSNVPIIAWGHRISLAYFTQRGITSERIEAVVHDICAKEQLACSSPQCIYVEVNNNDELDAFAQQLGNAFKEVSPLYPLTERTLAEQGEITQGNIMVQLGAALNETRLIEAEDRAWRIFVSYNSTVEPSPLYRTIWLKPIKRGNLYRTMKPIKRFMQTVCLNCSLEEMADVTEALVRCGVTRIVPGGKAYSTYAGEPHDGIHALALYTRRIAIYGDESTKTVASFNEITAYKSAKKNTVAVLKKEDFEKQLSDAQKAKLYFHSGGTGGKSVLSTYSYRDYNIHMQSAAEGLLAAGLSAQTDTVMNLLYGGTLYGGLISLFTMLEKCNIKQYAMGCPARTQDVAKIIVEQHINVLIGLPHYIMRIFKENEILLRENPVVQRIYYSGEPFYPEQKKWISDTFGVSKIQSAGYGSNDAGPIGYTCEYCNDGEHHLITGTMDLEILKMNSDSPVEPGEIGRIILSPKYRETIALKRYEIGDLGRWVPGHCPCGRTAPKFELMGRFGDLFLACGYFYNYKHFAEVVHQYAQDCAVQIVVENEKPYGKDAIGVYVSEACAESTENIKKMLLRKVDMLEHFYKRNELLVDVVKVPNEVIQISGTSQKMKHVIDNRMLC